MNAPPLYFDIETVPDETRLPSFGLDPVPPPPTETPADKCPPFTELLAGSIDTIKATLCGGGICPPASYLDQLGTVERAGKNRAGVHQAIAAAGGIRQAALGAAGERCKLLSTTPEYCRIAALGWAAGDDTPRVGVAPSPTTEVELLDKFWELASASGPLVGFNILGFDLPVILIRSAILGIQPSRMLNLSPYGNREVIDVYLGRFGSRGNTNANKPGKLKVLARLMGIDVPAGDVDGGDVYELLKSDPAAVGTYCKSDVEITRAYYRKLRGFLWV